MRFSTVLLHALPLGYGIPKALAGTLPLSVERSVVEHVPRQSTTTGTCISAPQAACASLVGLCISAVGSGQITAIDLWSSPVCFAAATCAGSAPLVDAVCCAGSCNALDSLTSLDYDNVYAPMVGSCAFQPNGCPVTWTDFVNYFYNTIQGTGTNSFPLSGDDVLAWWSSIATWTGFCSGNLCVDGQIPYTNLNDWLHFSWSTIVSQPGDPAIRDPPSSDRDENTDDWDPHYNSACPFTDPTLCVDDNSPQEPPDNTTSAVVQVSAARKINADSGAVHINVNSSVFSFSHVNLSNPFPFGKASWQPPNIPPPVFINNGTTPVPLNLTFGSPTVTVQNGAPQSRTSSASHAVAGSATLLDADPFRVLPAVRSDNCKGSIDTPNPLPTLTYYCDYLPNICANIRGSGFLTNDQVILTYDPFNTGTRRRGVCTPAQKAILQAAGKCDPRQHDPSYWKVSCDEFPFNSALEGGLANGAVIAGVPEIEQSFQSTLQTSISTLLREENEARSQWKKAGSLGSQFPGMCHKYLLQLTDTRPPTADLHAVGTLDTGAAWLSGQQQNFLQELTNSRAVPPPDPLDEDTDYLDTDTALQPSRSYKTFDCSPCSDDESGSDEDLLRSLSLNNTTLRNALPPTVTLPPVVKRQGSGPSCSITTTVTARPTETSAAQADSETQASNAAAAAAAAAAALAATSALTAAEQAAAEAAAAAAADVAAAAAALAAATAPADIANALDSATSALDDAQSIFSSFTSIFHFNDPSSPPPSSAVNMLGASLSNSISSTSNTVTDKWNVKPPTEAPVPPYVDPSLDPNVNNVNSPGGGGFPAATCFTAGSQGFLKIGDVFFTNANGNAPATLVNEGSDAFFGLEIPTPRSVASICSGVYQWTGDGPGPFWQVDCNTMEFGTYWNGVKQSCYTYSNTGTNTFGVFCGNTLGNIYSCLQAQGMFNTLNPAFITWVPN